MTSKNNTYSNKLLRVMHRLTHTLSILIEYTLSMLRVWLEYGWSMARVWLEYGWSMARDCNATLRPLVREWLQPQFAISLLLLLTVGNGDVWGQDTPSGTDYSGVYYIKSYNSYATDFTPEYYFVPTINCFYNGDEDKPHLTTFKTGGDKNSIWRIVKVTDGSNTYYRIIHNATGKYLVVNDAIPELADSKVKQAHRKRVHLETIAPNNLDDNSLFTFTEVTDIDGIIGIKHKNRGSSTTKDGTDHYYLNPQNGNKDSYRALNGRDVTNYQGIIGFYGKTVPIKGTDGTDSRWKLYAASNTCANPVIQYTDASTIQISYPISDDTGWTIYYTTDGSDPSTNANREEITSTATITDLTGVTKVRAIATKDGWDDSDETVLIASGVTQMVQSKQCDAFYMVPPIVDGDLAYATTTNIPNAKMGWNFVPAGLYSGIQYYYIVNSVSNEYLFCNKDAGKDEAFIMKAEEDIDFTSSEPKDRAKFRLIVQADGSYKVISKWWAAENVVSAYYMNKKNGNNGGNALNLADGSSNTGLWNVIAAPSSPKTQFDASFASSSSVHFYEIQSATDNTYHILPPTTSTGKATANTTGVNPAWFFMPVEDNDTWIPYYHIRNAATGEYFYFNSSSFYTSTTIESGNEDRYMFVVVKSAYTTDPTHYNIIPKSLKDQANQASNSLNRNGTTLRIQNSRNTAASNWKLDEVALFCNNPVFKEDDGAISISCVPDITRIYYTTDGTNPDPNDENQRYTSTIPLSTTNQLLIKAISAVSNETISDVVTLLNKPDVTLPSTTDYNYTYNGTEKKPSVEVSITRGNNTVIAPKSPATYAVNYENNINVGTASVTITDNNISDTWYVWNASTTFPINPKVVTITANDASKTYNGVALTENGFSATALETGDTHTFTVVMTDGSTITNVGTQSNVIATVDGTAVTTGTEIAVGNYLLTTANGTLTVNPKTVTITANDASKAYDGTALTESGFTATALETGDTHTFTVVMTDGSTITNVGTEPNVIATVDGTTVTTGTETAVGNYLLTTVDGTLTISPKMLSITAKPKTITYGDAPANDGVTYSGFVSGEDQNVLSGKLAYAYDYAQYGNVGNTYTITPSGLTGVNYNISFVAGTLTVAPKEVELIWSETTSFVYDGASHGLTATAIGMVNDDEIGVTVAGAQTNAGNHTATASALTGDKAGNYKLPDANTKEFSITKVGLTITASNNAITYGDAPAGSGVTYEGFVNSETESVLGGTLDYDFSYTQYGDVGNAYTIKPKGLTSTNYTISFVAGTLTVAQKEVGLTWSEPTSFEYNGSPQAPTATATGLVNSDEIGITVTGAQTNAQTNVGEEDYYTATASALTGDKAGNYKLPAANTKKFTITPKSLVDGTTLASGYTLDFGEGNTILLTDDVIGSTLSVPTDYSVGEDTDPSDKYSLRTVTGSGNYTGSFSVRNVVISFTTDTDQEEWSATFVAEKEDESDIGLALPDGISAFIISGIQGDWAIPEPLNYIPEGVPVLLVAHKKINGFVPTIAEIETEAEITDAQKARNMLEEVNADTPGYDADTESAPFATKQIYILYKNEFVFNKAGNMKKGKVYLNPSHITPSPEPAPSRLLIAWNYTTGIKDGKWNVKDERNERWYTIDGRRLSGKPITKGLYIVGGKKIAVK